MAHSDKKDEVMAQGNNEDEEDKVILESPSCDELFKKITWFRKSSKYVVLQKKYKAPIIKNKSLLQRKWS